MTQDNQPVLHRAVSDAQLEQAAMRLPGVRPVAGPWLTTDAAYAAQMAVRRDLLDTRPHDVHAQRPEGLPAALSFLSMMLAALPTGFAQRGDLVICPDGARVDLDREAPLVSVGRILQQDVCILEKRGDEHVLTGAVLCFPASWTLSQKIGRPLVRIHDPVRSYDRDIAKRVQRLFDGVRPGRPLWRANALRYSDPALYQPRAEHDPRPVGDPSARFLRSERQTILRLTTPGAVAFVIHTSVARVGSENDDQGPDD